MLFNFGTNKWTVHNNKQLLVNISYSNFSIEVTKMKKKYKNITYYSIHYWNWD